MTRPEITEMDKLCRRERRIVSQDGSLLIVEIEMWLNTNQIHIGFPITPDGSNISPIASLFRLGIGYMVLTEIVDINFPSGIHFRNHIPSKIMD